MEGVKETEQMDLVDVPKEGEKTALEEDISGDGGVKKKILKEGEGWKTADNGWEVTVHYTGTLPDGTVFDSSRDREPFKFKLGAGSVIKGWDKGVKTMKKKEIASFVLAPEYAYGAKGSPPKIPPNATLHFEVELLDWQEEKDVSPKKDKSIMKKVLQEGEGWETPEDDSKVKVNYKLRVKTQDEIVEEKQDLEFICGEEQVVDGLDIAVQTMKKGEKALITVQPAHTGGHSDWPVPAGTVLEFEVELLHLEKEKSSWQMSNEEKFEGATKRRLEGNGLYAKQKYERAVKKYKKAIDFFQQDSKTLGNEERVKIEQVKLPCYLNTAVCHMKLQQFKSAVEASTKALEIDPVNVKALFRRGSSLSSMDEWESSLLDLERLLEIDPNNVEGKRELLKLKKKIALQNKKDKSLFGGMFEKFAAQDEAKKTKEEPTEEATQREDAPSGMEGVTATTGTQEDSEEKKE